MEANFNKDYMSDFFKMDPDLDEEEIYTGSFCTTCLEERTYNIEEEIIEDIVRGHHIKYINKIAKCTECGSNMFVPEINDENIEAFNNAVREKDDIISIAEIEEIIRKYNIKKRPLSLLLGWGETTLTRYLEGSVPTKEYSERLKLILNNSDEMALILENNKNQIKDVAYRKCKEALEQLKIEQTPAIKYPDASCKIEQVAEYLIMRCGDITPLALQKLLYYCQAFYKIFTGEYLFEDDCEAWVHGPVYAEVYTKYSEYGWRTIESKKQDICLDNQDEEEVVDCVAQYFGKYSGRVLEKMTHMEKPWRETRKGLKSGEGSNRIIQKELIEQYFECEKEKHNMINISDMCEYVDILLRKI